ncbi:lipocalin family protein [Sphingobacterium sp. xlx-130]|uniref:lipocalin family protein n=1 Tax=Sphingobacterium sp. xlx-130 TaxID=2654323 RepID=UPI0013DB811E|nr:lipocalin family protein [Sphingobacterium sp. xlx-130]
MMKKKHTIMGILMLAMIFGLNGCKEEKNGVEPEATLAGSWVFQSSIFDGVKENYGHSCSSKKDYVEFKSGGELNNVIYEEDCSEDVDKGTYSIDGDKVTLRSADIGTETYTFKISGKTLTMEQPGEVTTLVRK